MNGLLYCGVQILANCRVLSRIETNRKIKETGQQIENILIFFLNLKRTKNTETERSIGKSLKNI